MTKYHYGAIACIVLAMFFAAGAMQMEDMINDHEFKCKMIQEGTYPNVDKFYESNCK